MVEATPGTTLYMFLEVCEYMVEISSDNNHVCVVCSLAASNTAHLLSSGQHLLQDTYKSMLPGQGSFGLAHHHSAATTPTAASTPNSQVRAQGNNLQVRVDLKNFEEFLFIILVSSSFLNLDTQIFAS